MKVDKLQQCLFDKGLEEDIRRLADLQDASAQEHTWWQQLNPETDRLLPDSEWIVAMRLRLGAPVIPVDGLCGYCGERCMDSNGYHSLCCALGESTRGHNCVCNLHASFCGQADPGTAIEVPGLCPRAPSLRPADILTGDGHPTRNTAIDIGIQTPHAADAGPDPLQEIRKEKYDKYSMH